MAKYIAILLVFILIHLGANSQINKVDDLLANARKNAQLNHKKIFVKFSASWCGWCHKMEAALVDSTVQPIIDKYYVKVTFIILESAGKKSLETQGGEAYYKKKGGAQKGLPFWLILDAQEKLLANSNYKKEGEDLIKDGDNVGCPAEENEIEYFLRTLKSTSKITNNELEIVKNRFRKIKTQP